MIRKNIFLPESMIKLLARERKKTGLSMAEIVRRAVEEYFRVK